MSVVVSSPGSRGVTQVRVEFIDDTTGEEEAQTRGRGTGERESPGNQQN